jgi:hypothetical protein
MQAPTHRCHRRVKPAHDDLRRQGRAREPQGDETDVAAGFMCASVRDKLRRRDIQVLHSCVGELGISPRSTRAAGLFPP